VSLLCTCRWLLPDVSCIGNLFGNEYREKVDEFKEELAGAKESFDRSIGLEVFKVIHGIGGFYGQISDIKSG
jgi:hypothetical protein